MDIPLTTRFSISNNVHETKTNHQKHTKKQLITLIIRLHVTDEMMEAEHIVYNI